MDREELELLFSSETVREYVRETGQTFTDFQKAALLCHRGLLLKDEYSRLKELCGRTDDYVLKEQIEEYLEEMEHGFRVFQENSARDHIYVLKVKEESDHWDGEYLVSGYFSDWKKALDYGRKEKAPFEIEKYLVDGVAVSDDGTCSHNSVAGFRFDKDGEAVCLSCKDGMRGFGNKHFEEALIEIPNPFERGDIVRCKSSDGKELHGIVEERQEDWKKNLKWRLERVKEGDTCVDFTDLLISVAFLREDGTFDYSDSTTPLDLERYQPRDEDWANGSLNTILLCARDIYCGKGHISLLFEIIERYRQSNMG